MQCISLGPELQDYPLSILTVVYMNRSRAEHLVSTGMDCATMEQAGDISHGAEQYIMLVCSDTAAYIWADVSHSQVLWDGCAVLAFVTGAQEADA